MGTFDWRAQVTPDSRLRIVNRILNVIRGCLPDCDSVDLLRLHKMAQKFEEKIFMSAINQSDYLRKISIRMYEMKYNKILPSQGNVGIAPISVDVSKSLRNQNKIGLNSTYTANIPAEVRPSSSSVSLGQEKEYLLTQPDRFKRKRVSLENSSYSSERTEFGIPKDPSTTTVIHDHNDLFLQCLTDELAKKDELIAQLKEENINLTKKSEREKHELSAQLESSKKAYENAKTLLKDAHNSLEEVQKKNSDLEKSFGKLSKIKTEAV